MVRLPSGAGYWTVLDEELSVVPFADAFLRHQRFGRDGAESTTKAYAHAIALFLRWCARTERSWQAGIEQFALFMTWLAHAGPSASGADGGGAGIVLAGPGAAPARSASRINGVLTAVRGMAVYAVSAGAAPAGLVPLLYEVADDRDLPEQARGEDGRMAHAQRGTRRKTAPQSSRRSASAGVSTVTPRRCRTSCFTDAGPRLVATMTTHSGGQGAGVADAVARA